MTVGTTTGRVGSQTTAHNGDRRGERMTRNGAAFDTGHATTERCTRYRQSIGCDPTKADHAATAPNKRPMTSRAATGPQTTADDLSHHRRLPINRR